MYQATDDKLEDINLLSAKLDGSFKKVLNDPLMSGACIRSYDFIGGNNPYVAYFGEGITSNAREAHVANLDGTYKKMLNGFFLNSSGIDAYSFNKDNTQLLYSATEDNPLNRSIYKIDFNNNMQKTGIGPYFPNFGDFVLSPDGSKIVYIALYGDGINIVNADGSGGFLQLATTSDFFDDVRGNILFSPNSQSIAFQYLDYSDNYTYHLFTVDKNGTGLTKLTTSSGLIYDGVIYNSYKFSHDSTKIVYQKYHVARELFSDNVSGGAKVLLATNTNTYELTQSGANKIVYSQLSGALYSSNLDGTNNVQLSASAAHTVKVKSFKLINDNIVVYLANESDEKTYELFAINIDGTGKVKLNGSLISSGTVENYAVSEDGSFLVYSAFQDNSYVAELYKVLIDGSGRKKIHEDLVSPYFIGSYAITPNGNGVVVTSNRINRKRLGLFYLDLSWMP